MHVTTRRMTAATTAVLTLAGLGVGLAPTARAATAAATARPTDGWSVVALAPAKWAPRQTERIVLVSPTGKQYPIRAGVDAKWSVADVSNDGRRVLLTAYQGAGLAYQVLDVRTGRLGAVAGTWSDARFTNPTGQALIAQQVVRGGTRAVRIDLAGRTQVRYASANANTMLPSLDGRSLVLAGSFGIQVDSNANGALVRRIALPAGTRYGCNLGHWSDATHFTAACFATGSRSTVYRFSTTGGRPVPLTSSLTTAGRFAFGYTDSWATPKGQAVRVGSGCGVYPLGVVSGRQVRVVQPASGLVTVHGTSAWLYDQSACQAFQPVSLSRYDLATGRRQVLAGGTVNRGLVPRSAKVVDSHQ